MQPFHLTILLVVSLCLLKWASANTTAATPVTFNDPSSGSRGGIDRNMSQERFTGIPHIAPRIIGGDDAKPGDWPFMVSLWYKNQQHFCGGSILTDDTILTAAHCILNAKLYEDAKATDIVARIGSVNMEKSDSKYHFKVRTWGVHASFVRENLRDGYDIGILKLKRWINFDALGNDKVARVCLPENEQDVPVADKCVVMGWGFTDVKVEKASPTLKVVQVPIVRSQACAETYPGFNTQSLVCAGYKNGGKDSCVGDSGGPLVCPPKTNAEVNPWIQYGIVSFGTDGCAVTYALYTKVAAFIPWILERAEEQNKPENGIRADVHGVGLNHSALLDDIIWL